MTPWDDFQDEMPRLPLDQDTMDRLLTGTVDPDDAPPGYAEVARTLRTAGTAPTPAELAREGEAVAMIAGAVRSHSAPAPHPSPRSSRMHPVRRKVGIAALVLSGALGATIGLAAIGTLPA